MENLLTLTDTYSETEKEIILSNFKKLFPTIDTNTYDNLTIPKNGDNGYKIEKFAPMNQNIIDYYVLLYDNILVKKLNSNNEYDIINELNQLKVDSINRIDDGGGKRKSLRRMKRKTNKNQKKSKKSQKSKTIRRHGRRGRR